MWRIERMGSYNVKETPYVDRPQISSICFVLREAITGTGLALGYLYTSELISTQSEDSTSNGEPPLTELRGFLIRGRDLRARRVAG
jgi:hypothetical protein